MKQAYLLLIAFTLIFTACKKGVDDFPNTPNTGEIPGTTTNATYQPFGAGAKWVYHGQSGIGDFVIEDTRTTILNGKSKKIDGQVFYEGITTSSAGTISGYIGYNNGIYAQQAEAAALGLNAIMPIYNDRKNIGETYQQLFNYVSEGQAVNARFSVELLEKGISKTVRGVTYNDVVHTRIKTDVKLGDEWISYTGNEIYLAKGVGIIYATAFAFDMEIDKMELVSYTPGK
ncbi:hypothetical protein LJ707_16790 [Mucilaginibacter sp. UR6-1]|uniref:hypothetical protein n=1 Tax=Mucilaginibacter sp. UR6-1 TaxID=1435643 RepID=UPI001E65481E|nr:hypothetical protein [Mucilaginibacter sp. UR6-1]MCC8410603.1 hypothetical protein [Mucilaginibacter sp. UR6-1]